MLKNYSSVNGIYGYYDSNNTFIPIGMDVTVTKAESVLESNEQIVTLSELENDELAVKERISQLNAKKRLTVTEDMLRAALKRLPDYLCQGKSPECRVFINKLVKQVDVYNDRAEVMLTAC